MSLGQRLGPYEIIAPVGAGGMGEVYKARDTRLDRTVALKVLSAALADDPERRARFEREARAIAALSHPHICVVHDVGREGDVDYLVMEYLDGETLEQKLSGSGRRAPGSGKGSVEGRKPKGGSPLSVDDVLKIAIDIADALDKAHRAGIVHRDLKPANIMLTKSGAKLLDFGLAKLRGPAVPISMSGMERATTAGGPGTAAGTILGTMYYMAPEQVEGREADARSDIWSLGVVIYEMATGARPFDGTSAASVIGAILKDVPVPISARQPLAPRALDGVVQHCLEKDPEARWQSAADLRLTLRSVVASASDARAQSATSRPARRLTAVSAAVVVVAVAGVTAGIVVGLRSAAAARAAPPVVQFDVLPPGDAMLSPAPVASAAQVALSADGKQIAFVALKRRGASQIYVRAIDAREAHALPDTDGATFPFWSPDGQYIAFFAGRTLRKVAVAGGASQLLCDAPGGRGGTWSPAGVILFSGTYDSTLFSVADAGGQPSPVTTLNVDTEHALGHNWPLFLPDGRHFLYYQRAANPDYQGVYVGELGTHFRSPRVLATNGRAVYASGYLAFVRDGVLFAQAFDSQTFHTAGDPVRIADRVGYFTSSYGYSAIAVSPGDLLAFGPAVGATTSLRWFARDGTPVGSLGAPDTYTSLRLSLDGKEVAVTKAGPSMTTWDIWTINVSRDTASRVTTDPAADWFPAWTPDGAAIYFGSTRRGISTLFRKVGPDEEQIVDKNMPFEPTFPNDISRDGSLVYQVNGGTGYDLKVMSLDNPARPTSFVAENFDEIQARFSPNARFIAYASDRSGRFEVYVRQYPSGNKREPEPVSRGGGRQPEWRRDGKELFYLSADGKMMAVPVSTDGDFQAGTPRALFDVDIPEASAPYPTQYAVTADGSRFLVNTVVDQVDRSALTAILNWTEMVKKPR